MHRKLFIGGSFCINTYAKANNIQVYSIIDNEIQLKGFHNSMPLFIMDDAYDIHRDAIYLLISVAEELGFKLIQLQYDEEFPSEEEIENMIGASNE